MEFSVNVTLIMFASWNLFTRSRKNEAVILIVIFHRKMTCQVVSFFVRSLFAPIRAVLSHLHRHKKHGAKWDRLMEMEPYFNIEI